MGFCMEQDGYKDILRRIKQICLDVQKQCTPTTDAHRLADTILDVFIRNA